MLINWKSLCLPFCNELVLHWILFVLSGCCKTSICNDWQVVVTWCHWYLKEQTFAQHHSNREIILRVRTHESFVRKHVQRERIVSLSFITEYELSVTWLPSNWRHHAIFGVETAELNFYFTHASHDVFSCHGDFQNCIGVDDSCWCVPACCVAAGQRCSEWELWACFCGFACRIQEAKMLTVHTTEEGLGNGNGHILAVAMNINTWS